jgi:hypothetical protein
VRAAKTTRAPLSETLLGQGFTIARNNWPMRWLANKADGRVNIVLDQYPWTLSSAKLVDDLGTGERHG